MPRPTLSPTQAQYLQWIAAFWRSQHRSPTLLEASRHFHTSWQNAAKHILALTRKGYLHTDRKGPVRSLQILEEDGSIWQPNQLPLVGKVAAGKPILAVENRIGKITVDESFLKRGANFTLVVEGDSMVDVGILPGDKVIIRQQSSAASGQIALVLVDEEATIKRYYPLADGTVRLKAENSNYADWIVPSERCQVQGVVIGLFREIE
ncbi:MAG: transcriptional repressor LexA [bacterium]|nr:transcriptional repressor LexA [bacterium]